MIKRIKKIRDKWRNVKAKRGFRKFLTFLIFVFIAALFWFILALNDNIQDDFEVRVNITNVPDSVTFINIPPASLHVAVRDRGTNLWRNGVFSRAQLNINFKDFSNSGLFRVSHAELYAGLKNVFGSSAAILSTSIDSLRLNYTTLPGKRLPIVVTEDFKAAVGKIIKGRPMAVPKNVVLYGPREIIDTATRVFTHRITRHNLEETSEFEVALNPIKGARIEPAMVKVKVNIEPLVRKQSSPMIQIDNVPEGLDLLLFPNTAKVEYYIPMSKFGNDEEIVELHVDFRDLKESSSRLPVRIGASSPSAVNIRLLTDSVEYTLVRN